jgi:hypothetical protein
VGARLAQGADQAEADLTKCLSHRVDERLRPSEVAQIEAQVRRRTKFPIVFVGDRGPAAKGRRLDRVEVQVLETCNSNGSGGSTFFLHRTKRGWKLELDRGGEWGAVG